VYGDGSQTRSFCYVDDLIEGLVRLMATRAEVTGPMNIGNPAEFSMLELATMGIDLTGSHSRNVTVRVRRTIQSNDGPPFRAPTTGSIGSRALCLRMASRAPSHILISCCPTRNYGPN